MAFNKNKAEYLYKNSSQFTPLLNGTTELSTAAPQVNSTIKSLPRDTDVQNSEIEKGEVIISGDGNLLVARGKSHAEGGIPVNLPDNSFILSNHKPLAISREDKELYGFKQNSNSKKNSTPAAVLKREVDIPHHNKMVAIQGSDDHDMVSKKSSELMLTKNFQKIGQVAYLQEEKKGFPQSVPGISEGTAPVLNTQLQEQADTNKQYKMGGFTRNYQVGGAVWMGDRYKPRKAGSSASNATKYSQQDWDDFASTIGYDGKLGTKGFQQYLYDFDNGRFKSQIDQLHKDYAPGPNSGMFDGKLGVRWDAVYNSFRDKPIGPINPGFRDPNMSLAPPDSPQDNTLPGVTVTSTKKPQEQILPYTPQVGMSPEQKLSLAYDAFNATSVPKFYPKREQVTYDPLQLDRVSAQPYLSQVDQATSQAFRQNQALNPIIARAQNSQVYGQSLNQRSQVLGNVNNQNIQIGNQEAQYNNQNQNRTNAQNTQLDQSYYDQVNTLNQNYSNESKFATNNLVSQYNQYLSQNKQLQQELASQQTPGTIDVWQGPNGQLSKTPVAGWKQMKQAAPLYDIDKDRNFYYTGAGMNPNQLPAQGGQNLSFQQVQSILASSGLNDVAKGRVLASWITSASRNPYGNR